MGEKISIDFYHDAGNCNQQINQMVDDYSPEVLSAIRQANISGGPVPRGIVNPIEFPHARKRPRFIADGEESGKVDSRRMASVLNRLIDLIEHHAAGTYDDVLKDFHLSGRGVSEALPLLSQPHRRRLAAPGNVYEQMKKMLDGKDDETLSGENISLSGMPLSISEIKVVYTALIAVDKNTHGSDDNVAGSACADQYDHSETLRVIAPFIDHYKSHKVDLSSAKQMLVPGHKYPGGGRQIGQSHRLRPETKDPLLVGKWTCYHAAFAIVLDALQNNVKQESLQKLRDQRKVSEAKFAREKEEAREKVLQWSRNTALGLDNKTMKPEYYPNVDAQATLESAGLNVVEGIRACPILVGVNLPDGSFNEAEAAAALNTDTNEWLTLFQNNGAEGEEILGSITSDLPPISKKQYVEVSEEIQKFVQRFQAGAGGL